jgi:chaperonin GroES
MYNTQTELKMILEPLGTRVVVRVQEAQTKTAGGILIPSANKEKPTIGTIVAINDTTRDDFNVEVGTKLLFGKFAGTEITVDNESLLILEIDEALAIIRD